MFDNFLNLIITSNIKVTKTNNLKVLIINKIAERKMKFQYPPKGSQCHVLFNVMILGIIMASFFISGCGVTVGTSDTYDWYGLYLDEINYNRHNLTIAEYVAELQNDAIDAAQDENNLPPGFLAELGMGYYFLGKYDKAIQYLENEYAKWPEAKYAQKLASDIKEKLNSGALILGQSSYLKEEQDWKLQKQKAKLDPNIDNRVIENKTELVNNSHSKSTTKSQRINIRHR